MAFLKEIKLVFATLTLVFLHQKSYSQEAKVSVSQDPKFEQLLNEKRKINSSITINDRYKIQIFNGDTENSKKTLQDFKRENKNHYRTFLVNLFMNFFRVMHLLHIQILLSNKGPI